VKVGLSIGGGVGALDDIDPRHLAEDGFSSVFVACHERDMLWHAPRAADFARASQAAGLQVYVVPLGYGRVIDPDPSIESLYVREHPHNCQIDNRGRRCTKACPNNPSFLEWFSSNMRTLAWLLECQGFLWDEPSFYSARGGWGCRCEYCERLYYAEHECELPVDLSDSVVRFRRSSMTMSLLAAAAAIKSVDRRLSSVVMPSSVLTTREAGLGLDELNALAGSAAGLHPVDLRLAGPKRPPAGRVAGGPRRGRRAPGGGGLPEPGGVTRLREDTGAAGAGDRATSVKGIQVER